MSTVKLIMPLFVFGIVAGCATQLPPVPAERQNQWAEQGWTNDERQWYHHAVQGTNTFGLPYEWFIALEQPEFSLSEVALFADQRFLSRMGFIPSPASLQDQAQASRHGYPDQSRQSKRSEYSGQSWNTANLPVGFAVGSEWFDPASDNFWPIPGTGKNAHSLGLTCAACHTGQIEYGNHRILIDGGQGMISLDKFRGSLKIALAYTKLLPGRFERFAKRVLWNAYTPENGKRLKAQFDSFLSAAKKQGDLEAEMVAQGVVEGFTRLDALNRIGNEVFANQMKIEANMFPISAPVSFPFIWNAPWLDWVQYNSSIQQPMVRNAGEAMGVKGMVNLSNPQKQIFASKLPLETLHEMEILLAGPQHPLEARRFGGLRSPDWKTLPLPALNEGMAANGQDLYMGNPDEGKKPLCAGCHLPPISSPEIFDARRWREAGTGFSEKYLALITIPVTEIATDCKAAFDMAYRTVRTPDFIGNSGALVPPFTPQQTPADCSQPLAPTGADGQTVTNFGVALGEVVEAAKEAWYASNAIGDAKRRAMDGNRPNGIRAVIGSSRNPDAAQVPRYKARPLNGVWSTAPFLHNGSVPNLYLLLSTQADRDAEASEFFLGSREFDPRYVGFSYRADDSPKLPGARALKSTQGLFLLDTKLPGNRNTGHLFTDEQVSGRIGPRLSEEDRFALIEFLKSL